LLLLSLGSTLLLEQLVPDDQEGRSEAQNTADGEQGGDPVLVRQSEGQVLQKYNFFRC